MFSCLRTLQFRKKDTIILCIVFVLFVLGLIQWWYLPLTSTLDTAISDPYFITRDENGNSYIIDEGKSEILKLSPQDRVLTRISCFDHGEDTFHEANEIAVDSGGNIYVQDVIWNDTGLGMDSERILRFDPEGNFLDVLFVNDYSELMIMKRHLFSLIEKNGDIWFAAVDGQNNHILSYKIVNEEAQVQQEIPWQDAEDIQSIALGENGTFYLANKRGDVYRVNQLQRKLLYEVPKKTYIMPYYLTVSQDGTLYFTDICNQEIYEVQNDQVTVVKDRSTIESITGSELNSSILQTIRTLGNGDSKVLCMAFNDRIGYLNLSDQTYTGFDEVSYPYQSLYQKMIAFRFAAFLIAAVVALYYLIVFLRYCIVNEVFARSRTSLIVFLAVIVSTMIVMTTMLSQFQNTYIQKQVDNICSVTQIASSLIDSDVMDDVKYPKNYGSKSYHKLQQYMENLIDVTSQYSENMYCNLIKVEDDRCYAFAYLDNSIGAYYPLDEQESAEALQVYDTGEFYINDGKSDATGSYVYVKQPIKNLSGEVVGIVEIGMVSDTLSAMVKELRMNITVAIFLIVIIIVFLLNEYMNFSDERKRWKERRIIEGWNLFPIPYFRLLVFFCFAAYNMPTSFLPVYIEKFYDESLPFSRELAGSLPLTVNFMVIGVMSLFCARFIRKMGFRVVAILGGLFCLAGDLSMALSANYWMAAGGLVLNGIGCGFCMNAFTIVVANQEEEDQAEGFSVMNGAMLSGTICGTVIGAVIAQRLGSGRMFFCSAGIWLLIALLALLVGKAFFMDQKEAAKPVGTAQFLFTGKIMGYFILVLLPYSITNGFTSYFLPIFGNDYGLTESQTSLLLVMNCLVGIFLSKALTKVMQKNLGRFAIYLSALLSVGAMVLFAYFQNIFMLAFVLFLLGAVKSFGAPIRELIFCGQREVQDFGEDRAMGLYNFADNVGDSLGTVVFGEIMSVGFSVGVWALAAVTLGMAVIYEGLWKARWGKRKHKHEK